MTEPASFFKETSEGILLYLKVQPRSSKNQWVGVVGNRLKVKLTAPPVDSAANEALVAFTAQALGCSRNQVSLIRGDKSREKTLQIIGVSPKLVLEGLGLNGGES